MKRVKMVVLNGGFTIAELLIALAISAMLLSGLAVVFDASFISYKENMDIREANKTVWLALMRLTTEIRTAQAADPCSPTNECTLLTADGRDITYRFEEAEKKLYYITNDDLTDPNYVLCYDVADMNFTKQTFEEDSQWKVRGFQINMTVVRGKAKKEQSAAAVIRRNLRR